MTDGEEEIEGVATRSNDRSRKRCGIVMPISQSGECSAAHWAEVMSIVEEVCVAAGYETRLVSDTFETSLIHKEILQNLYNDEIVVCDVSTHNPNVFFELGIRMATQKPVVILKDDKTKYPFDTSPNRYIQYPRDLRYPLMLAFKVQLKEAIAHAEQQTQDRSFIGQLGPFKVPAIQTEAVGQQELVMDRLARIEGQISRLRSPIERRRLSLAHRLTFDGAQIRARFSDADAFKAAMDVVQSTWGSVDFAIFELSGTSATVRLRSKEKISEEIITDIKTELRQVYELLAP